MQERDLYPYETTAPTGVRSLVLSPHPDDETIGCGGTIALHRAAGDPLTVVFLTDGAEGATRDQYEDSGRQVRMDEGREALSRLGGAESLFWGYPDRRLADRREEAAERLAKLIAQFRPGRIYCPSPLEIHPDHVAAWQILQQAVQDLDERPEVWLYEIAMPLHPNRLVDISAAKQQKARAVDAFASQLAVLDLHRQVRALSQLRLFHLPAEVTAVEAFFRVAPEQLTTRLDLLMRWEMTARGPAPQPRSSTRVSVIVRTRDRPRLLEEALASLALQTWRNFEVLVVDSGVSDASAVLAGFADRLTLKHLRIGQQTGRGRALNAGIEAAEGEWICYLDDDDLVYPEHLETLTGAMQQGTHQVVYLDCYSVTLRKDADGAWQRLDRRLAFSRDFSAECLVMGNYLPIHTVMHTRAAIDEAGTFDESLPVYEDWDMWIRLSLRQPFAHVARATCEYRFRLDGDNTLQLGGLGPLERETLELLKQRYADRRAASADQAYQQQGELADQRLERQLRIGEQRDLLRQQNHALRQERDRLAAERTRSAEQLSGLEGRVLADADKIQGLLDKLARIERRLADNESRLQQTESGWVMRMLRAFGRLTGG